MVSVEAGYVVKRMNAQLAAEISLMQMALSSIPNESVKAPQTKKSAAALKKHLKELLDG